MIQNDGHDTFYVEMIWKKVPRHVILVDKFAYFFSNNNYIVRYEPEEGKIDFESFKFCITYCKRSIFYAFHIF